MAGIEIRIVARRARRILLVEIPDADKDVPVCAEYLRARVLKKRNLYTRFNEELRTRNVLKRRRD